MRGRSRAWWRRLRTWSGGWRAWQQEFQRQIEASAEAGAGARGGGGEGGQQEGDLGRGQGSRDGDGVQGRERGEWGLSGEEVVRVWNAAVWEQLRECEGWECGDRGHAWQDEQQPQHHGLHSAGAV